VLFIAAPCANRPEQSQRPHARLIQKQANRWVLAISVSIWQGKTEHRLRQSFEMLQLSCESCVDSRGVPA
jgi:hypothetical protein